MTDGKPAPRQRGGARGVRALAILLACTLGTVAQAQIRTDGTLGGPAVTLAGPNFLINEALGRLAGSNLFHSFQVFSVGSTESATFVTGTAGLANVISRVTGGSASQINGLVTLDAANAAPNFFFINPAGVVFGEGAQINVPAGFYVSTANYLSFPDGNFYADPNTASTLSSAAPEAFGFLGTTRAAITIKDGALLQTTSPKTEQAINIVAGDVAIDGGQVQTGGSDIRAIAVGASVQEVGLTGPLPDAHGELAIVNGGYLLSTPVGADKAGNIQVAAGDVVIDGRGTGLLTGVASRATAGTGDGGSIGVTAAGQVYVVRGGTILSDTFTSGNAGAIDVTGGEIVIDRIGVPGLTGIASQANAGSSGAAGDVRVTAAGTLAVVGRGTIASNTLASGRAGAVEVAAETLVAAGGGVISSNTSSSGNAGALTVNAQDIILDGEGSGRVTGITSRALAGAGNAGSVDVNARGELYMVSGGDILSDTSAAGNAGPVKVSAGAVTIDGQGSAAPTGIFTSAAASSVGNAGDVEVSTGGPLTIVNGGRIDSGTASPGRAGAVTVSAGTLSLVNGGVISSNAFASGNAGSVRVSAGDLVIDGAESPTFTGISSSTSGGTGNADSVDVAVAGALTVARGGEIASNTFGFGDAGVVKVTASTIVIDGAQSANPTGIFSSAFNSDGGRAGDIDVSATGMLSLVNGGTIDTGTASPGPAGTVKVSAGTLSIASGGAIGSDTFSSGNAGVIKVNAGDMIIDSMGVGFFTGISSSALDGTGNAGNIDVSVAGALAMVNGGTINSSTLTSGQAGTIKVAAGNLQIDAVGSGLPTGVFSLALDGTGNAGNIDVTVNGTLAILEGGGINSSTLTSGQAGTVTIAAADLLIDGKAAATLTGISSSANGGTGNAGMVNVVVASDLSLMGGGQILSDTFSAGNAGTIRVAAGTLTIDGKGSEFPTGIFSAANQASEGNAGNIEVIAAGRLALVNGGTIDTSTSSRGRAGTVTVSAGTLSMVSGGAINSSTESSGNAGAVTVVAGAIDIDRRNGESATGIASRALAGTGNAGSVDVTASGMLAIVDGGVISSSTFSSGQAGTVKVTAGDMVIDGRQSVAETGIASQANFGSGDAGSVEVTVAHTLSIANKAGISSGTVAAGRGGSVRVDAGTLIGDTNGFIGATADEGSSGQTGTVSIAATEGITLSNGAAFTIRNDATVADPDRLIPTLLTVSAPYIALANGGEITAASSGNVAASNIAVNFGPQLSVSNARVSTSANDGDGGAIAVGGSGTLVLRNGQVTTSVAGQQGNGGDIGIEALNLVMETGFIQANTAAANASGGDVNIQVGGLIPSGSTLFVAGATPYTFAPGVFGFNVIQAAAPTGVSGTVSISTPALDIVGSITALAAGFLDEDALGQSRCAIVGGSSLSRTGRGGLPPAAGGLLWIEPPHENAVPPVPGVPLSGRWRFPLGADCGAVGGY